MNNKLFVDVICWTLLAHTCLRIESLSITVVSVVENVVNVVENIFFFFTFNHNINICTYLQAKTMGSVTSFPPLHHHQQRVELGWGVKENPCVCLRVQSAFLLSHGHHTCNMAVLDIIYISTLFFNIIFAQNVIA